jgi:hypothetical protein
VVKGKWGGKEGKTEVEKAPTSSVYSLSDRDKRWDKIWEILIRNKGEEEMLLEAAGNAEADSALRRRVIRRLRLISSLPHSSAIYLSPAEHSLSSNMWNS